MKTFQFRTLLAVVVVLAVAAWIASQKAQGAEPGQQSPRGGIVSNSQSWIYRVDPVPTGQGYSSNTSPADVEAIRKRNADEIERLLNQRGAEGWELAAVGTSNLYFKRPK